MLGNATWNETFGSYNDSLHYYTNGTNIEKVVSVMVPVFFGMIGLTGLIGNGLVVLDQKSSRFICQEGQVICTACDSS
ncbi:allatostatin receptor [Culex quinquefasciatus]|uniref:Allatostatin receptor n=1 Tax=Culex quinquefasciatus TaxID=7176 RepID=B0X9R3_CULQU|nr:allatostatin receptor [Culex quinquefasciatus]|eukprot:XP_001866385.1 allatostatin receptor [Culex quinquefasciatus]